ncbi:MAG TPA: GlsB/YeaQ/YmgE family stress response membrane protein [Candidatus Dormibacteraeota bacterium]
MDLSPGGIIAWIIVGLIAGWAASVVSRGHGYGLIGDLVVGLIGALIGGFVAGFFIHGSVGLVGTIIVAFLGALILLFVLRMFGRGRARAS